MGTVKEVFEAMPASFQKGAAAGLNAVFQFDITGDGGGRWYAEIRGGELSVVEGERPNPDVLLTASAADYLAVSEGRMGNMAAFASGKVKVKGNLGLAMKMPSIFKRKAG